MKKTTLIQLIAATVLAYLIPMKSNAQSDEGFLYGEVVMINNEKYIGQIRWGKEEAFWDDIFNSNKPDNDLDKYVDDDDWREGEKENSSSFNWEDGFRFMKIWEDRVFTSSSHQFTCRYGDIKSMKITGSDRVRLEFKDGSTMEVEGGSNDLGARIKVLDPELGEMDLSWERIERINFMPTPKTLQKKIGEPLFATVKTYRGDLKGFIQWDHEECLSTDKLDGETDNGKMSIEMGNIDKIEVERSGVKVTLKSGRAISMHGSNDVNSDNRGIVVKNVSGFGKALIEWREFQSIDFEQAPNSGPAYSDFKTNKDLTGKVKTVDGQTYEGRIVYDIDESSDWEMLDGQDGGIKYEVPFRNIKLIKPKNYSYTHVGLVNGDHIVLSDSQDVTDQNDGILVWVSKDKEPVYIAWSKVEEIELK